MSSYSELSKAEINLAIAKILYPLNHSEIMDDGSVCIQDLDDSVDYVNNPADSWKLMTEMVSMGFDVMVRKNLVNCFKPGFRRMVHSEQLSSGRSMGECFLMIKGGEV